MRDERDLVVEQPVRRHAQISQFKLYRTSKRKVPVYSIAPEKTLALIEQTQTEY